MKTLYCPEYPNLRTHNPTVWFVGGVAEVSDEDAKVLLTRTKLGITESTPASFPAQTAAHAPEEDTPSSEGDGGANDSSPVKFPGKNATVAEWVAFCAEHSIEHAEDATKAEMKTAAEKHFAE